MLRRNLLVVPLAFVLFSTSACAGSPDGYDFDVRDFPSSGLHTSALNANALNANALNANALYPAALTPGMLGVGPLGPSTLEASVLAALHDPTASGDLSRQLLKYTVSCAFDTTQSFPVTWVDAEGVTRDETYPGLLGLATGWASQALGETGQRWVSACLASRVNWYGVAVSLSSRGAAAGLVTPGDELAAYSMEEGAFWGNLFTSSPAVYACDDTPNDSYSRSRYRDCAAGHVESSGDVVSCGPVQRVGSCEAHCLPLNAAHYHPGCGTTPVSATAPGSAVTTDALVITVFLQ